MVPGLFVAGLFVVYFFRQPPSTVVSSELVISGPTMGTTFNVKVVTDDLTEANRERLTQLIREVLDGVDEHMSTYRPESEIEQFNRGTPSLLQHLRICSRWSPKRSGCLG